MKRLTLAALAAAAFAMPAGATTLRITIQNLAGPAGLGLTPLWVGFHSASFDAFDAGTAASAGVEDAAEIGVFSTVGAELVAADADSQAGAVFGAGGPILPGETASADFDVDGSANPLLTFLAMVLPSNDTFLGTDNPIALFDASGSFLGAKTIAIGYDMIFDAGTEVNATAATVPAGAAPLPGATGGDAEGGVVSLPGDLTPFAGLDIFGAPLDAGDLVIDSKTVLALISVAEVPSPLSALLLGTALGGLGLIRRRA